MTSSELKGFFTGLLIGDGTLAKGVTKRSFEIKSINEDFITMLKTEIEKNTPFNVSVRFVPRHFSCGCNHKDCWVLTIKAHPYFAKLYFHFYNDYRRRIITKYTIDNLTPLAVALWYMCDGYVTLVGKTKSFIKNRRIDFCTDRYTMEEVEMLKKAMFDKFGIETSVIKRDKFFRLRVTNKSYNTFLELISPYIVSSMRYKIYLGYEKRQPWMSDKIWELQCSINSATRQAEGLKETNCLDEDIVC